MGERVHAGKWVRTLFNPRGGEVWNRMVAAKEKRAHVIQRRAVSALIATHFFHALL